MRRIHAAALALLAVLPWPAAAQQATDVNYIRRIDGTAARPSDTYLTDTDLGRYRIGANNEGFTAGGTLRWDYNTTRMKLSPGYTLELGHIAVSQTAGDQVVPLTIQSTDATKGPWNLIVGDATFNGTVDSTMYLGYNVINGGGNSIDT